MLSYTLHMLAIFTTLLLLLGGLVLSFTFPWTLTVSYKFLPSFGIYFSLRRLRCQISFLRHSFHDHKSELYICIYVPTFFVGHVVP